MKGAAQQLVNGLVVVFPSYVPEGYINATYGVNNDPTTAIIERGSI